MSEQTYEQIVQLANSHAETIANDMLAKPKRMGTRIFGDCFGKASVTVKGSNTGLCGFWLGQRGAKQGGNLIDLVQIAKGFSNHGQAVRYVKRTYLGLPDREMTAEEKREFARNQRQAEQRAQERATDAAGERFETIAMVKSLWASSASLSGTLAERYLIERGLGEMARVEWPATLRFHPNMPFSPMDDNSKMAPALVAAVQAEDRSLVAIWRIFLNPDGTNLKWDGKKVKLGFGPSSGGCVRLTPVGPDWNVGEGLESTLAAQALSGFKGGWAATLSTSGMSGLVIPKPVKKLGIWTDGDRYRRREDGTVDIPPGLKAGRALEEKAKKAGVDAWLNEPPENSDWLDVWSARNER